MAIKGTNGVMLLIDNISNENGKRPLPFHHQNGFHLLFPRYCLLTPPFPEPSSPESSVTSVTFPLPHSHPRFPGCRRSCLRVVSSPRVWSLRSFETLALLYSSLSAFSWAQPLSSSAYFLSSPERDFFLN